MDPSQAPNLDPEANLGEEITLDNIRNVLDQYLVPVERMPGDISEIFHWTKLNWTSRLMSPPNYTQKLPSGESRQVVRIYNEEERRKAIEYKCVILQLAAANTAQHVKNLHAQLVQFFESPTPAFCVRPQDKDTIAQWTWDLFARMPARPPALPDTLDEVPAAYFRQRNGHTEKSWDNLKESRFVPKVLIMAVEEGAMCR